MEMNESFSSTTTQKTLTGIRKALTDSIEKKYKKVTSDQQDVVNKFLYIHGLHKDNFDFVKCAEDQIKSNINDISIDDNANKNEKTIRGMLKEVESAADKAMGFDFLYRQLCELYGKEEARRLEGEMLDLSLGLSDSTNILLPYCWALDASKINFIGRDFGQLHSSPAKHLTSYIGALNETVHQMSSHLAGAIAVGSFFLDIAHILIYRDKIGMHVLRTNCEIRKEIENMYQSFIHSMNSLSRNAVESPFTNVSIFDREKLHALISEGSYGWYFEKTNESLKLVAEESFINDLEKNNEKVNFNMDKFDDYLVEYLMECQNIFLDIFDRGDPLKNGAPIRFPIITINISKKINSDGEVKVPDQKFLRSICKRDVYRYNIFTSAGSKISSCCRLLSDMEMLDLAAQSNSFGGSSVSLGSHRVVTINFNRIALECKSIEEYYFILEDRVNDAAKILAAHKKLLQWLADIGMQLFIKNGWINLNRMFSTFGILGIYEADKTLRKRFHVSKDHDLIKDILKNFNDDIIKAGKENGIIVNCEQIPGESFAVRLCTADKLLYGKEKVPYEMYANQFVPLWEDATLWERFDEDGKYNQMLTGGGIVHAQIGEKVTPKQAEKIITYAIKSGCEHFALNGVFTEFEDGTVIFGRHDKHPVSGSIKKEWYTRIVGYFTPVSSWNKTRREWEFNKRTFVELPDDII